MRNMGNSDQENLLPQNERDHRGSPTISFRFNNNNYQNSKSQVRKNLLLLTISIFIITCLAVYLYLNYVAINGVSTSSSVTGQTEQTSQFKPLSRRKPMLDHESIFSESGPSLLKLSDLMAHCIVALHIGGERVVQSSLLKNDKISQIGSKGNTREGAEDVVTGADMQSHEAILNTIKDTYRRLKIVSEEDTTSAFENLKMEDDILPIKRTRFAAMLRDNLHNIEGRHGTNNNWPLLAQHETLVWIDPLDATKEFSENLTEYVTLMACIVHKDVPIAGIVYKPFLNKTYWSLKDETKQRVIHSSDLLDIWSQHQGRNSSKNAANDKIKITVSRSHAGDVESTLRDIYGQSAEIVPAGGSGYKSLELIEGNVNAYVHVTYIKKWDICAPHALLNSLPDGKMTDLRGGAIHFGNPKEKVVKNGLIASFESKLHSDLIDSFASYTPV